jgi:hypothetical protein
MLAGFRAFVIYAVSVAGLVCGNEFCESLILIAAKVSPPLSLNSKFEQKND